MSTRYSNDPPWLVGTRTWLLVGFAIVVVFLSVVALVLWEQHSFDRECERLERRTVTNQGEADRLFDQRAAAGCLGRN